MSDVAGGCGDDDDDGMKIILHAFFFKRIGLCAVSAERLPL